MYVIQYFIRGDGFKPGTWNTLSDGGVPKRYPKIEDAQSVLSRIAWCRSDYRIAEEYTVIRYKAVK